jgi:hypothetical protein
MATRTNTTFFGFNWRTVFMTAGIAILAPYLIRRMLPLIQGNAADVTAGDVMVAGKDSARDVADDLGVGGVSGSLSRGVDRVVDHLSH